MLVFTGSKIHHVALTTEGNTPQALLALIPPESLLQPTKVANLATPLGY